jgi:hypothetical protein
LTFLLSLSLAPFFISSLLLDFFPRLYHHHEDLHPRSSPSWSNCICQCRPDSSKKLIDVTANNNGDGGIFNHPISQSLEIIRSTACYNDAFDGSPLGNDIAAFEIVAAQRNTCDTGLPEDVNGLPICDCRCKGGPKSSLVASGDSIIDTTAMANATKPIRTRTPAVVLSNETVAAVVRGV